MSVQRELDVDVLMELYILVDKGSGLASKQKLLEHYAKEGVGQARVEHSLRILSRLEMVEESKSSKNEDILKLSGHGIEWFEEHFVLVGRNPYEFSTPFFKRVILRGPTKGGRAAKSANDSVNWQKWGAILTGIGVVISLAIWKFS